MLFLEGQAQQAELGELAPQLARKAVRLLRVFAPGLEVVVLAQQPLDAVLQQPLLVAELEIHFPGLSPPINSLLSFRDGPERAGPGIHIRSTAGHGFRARGLSAAPRNDDPIARIPHHRPRIALAMMFFWISLVPP